MNPCSIRISVIISALGLIVMPLRGQDGAFLAFASLTQSKQVLLAYLVLDKSRVKESMSERSSECEGKAARVRGNGVGVRGCKLEAGRAECQGKRPEDVKDCGGVGMNCRNGLWEGGKRGGTGYVVRARWARISAVLRGPCVAFEH